MALGMDHLFWLGVASVTLSLVVVIVLALF
jgi:hypothetical protein